MTAPHHARRGCRTDIDWSAKPAPWREIGPAFRQQCERIVRGSLPQPKPFDMDRRADGLALRLRRLALGLRQEDVGRKAGYDANVVSEVEGGLGWAPATRAIDEALTQLSRGTLRQESQKVNEPTHDLDGGARPRGSRAQRPGR